MILRQYSSPWCTLNNQSLPDNKKAESAYADSAFCIEITLGLIFANNFISNIPLLNNRQGIIGHPV